MLSRFGHSFRYLFFQPQLLRSDRAIAEVQVTRHAPSRNIRQSTGLVTARRLSAFIYKRGRKVDGNRSTSEG